MNLSGLSTEEVAQSRQKYGDNTIPDSEPTTFWEAFGESFEDPMIRVLLVIAAMMIVMFFFGYSEIYEPAGTIVAVLIVAFVSAKTSVSSDSKYRQLKDDTKKDQCKVYRNGSVTVIDVDDVVQGDLIILQSGDKMPADGILKDGRISVDNAALNGETEECKKTAADDSFQMAENLTGDTFVDAHSLFRGAVVVDGDGVMEVCRVGVSTMMGKMASEMQETEVDSPLKVKLTKLASQISTFGYIGAVVIAVLYIIHYISQAGGLDAYMAMGAPAIIGNVVDAIALAVVIIVCAVPEGLPLMISLVLMQNTSKMLDHNVLVRQADGIETAGALNILFSDKTGTITKGQLEVVEFFTADGEVITPSQHNSVGDLLNLAIAKNTQSMFDDRHMVIGGNATDQALMKFLGEDSFNKVASAHQIVSSQSFNSANKFSQAQVGTRTYYKGAPERLLKENCKYIDKNGKIQPMDAKLINAKIDQLAEKAMRVLAFGYTEKSMETDKIHEDIVIIGLVGIRDDVRPEAKSAIEEVQRAGVQVVMITGDRLETAVAIAKDAGLLTSESDKFLASTTLNEMSDDEVKAIMPEIRVIARALPTDKSRMVRLCQEMNLVVGMTGDGVNDSPALKRADVGFAMGSGTEAAKEAGKIVILDDNFQSIKDAIWYGRTIYHNILKFCKFQLVINVVAVVVSALAPFLGVEEPLKVTHLLFVNLVMDGLGAIMLGNEPALHRYLLEKPRNRNDNIISKPMMAQILFMGAWMTVLSFVFLLNPTFSSIFETEEQHLTAYFVLFIVSALFNGFNVRHDGYKIFSGLNENTGFMKVFVGIILIQAMIVNAAAVPLEMFHWIGEMFSCVPFGINGWLTVFALAFTMIPVDLLRKTIVNGGNLKDN